MSLTSEVSPPPPESDVRPATTTMSAGEEPTVQWAAVTTLLAATSVPPQNWKPSGCVNATVNGKSSMFAGVPPTIFGDAVGDAWETLTTVTTPAAATPMTAPILVRRRRDPAMCTPLFRPGSYQAPRHAHLWLQRPITSYNGQRDWSERVNIAGNIALTSVNAEREATVNREKDCQTGRLG